MRINYTVHSVANDTVDALVDYRGEQVTAKVPVVTVELVSDDPAQSNPVLRIRPESEAELKAWAQGARIIGSFTPEPAQQQESPE